MIITQNDIEMSRNGAGMEENTKKTDRRVLRTKKSIKRAFASLLAKKAIQEITIKELAEAADINRKTFYNYYTDIHQVMEEIEDDVIAILEPAIKKVDFAKDMMNPYVIVQKLSVFDKDDIEFYGDLFQSDIPESLVEKFADVLKEYAKISFASYVDIDDIQMDFMINYAIAGMLAVYRTWFTAKDPVPLQKLSRWTSVMTLYGVSGMLDPERNQG